MSKEQEYQKMYAEYISGDTFQQIADKYGKSPQSIHNAFKRRNWDTRREYISRNRNKSVELIDDNELIAHKSYWNSLDSKVKGTITESNVRVWLASFGYDVWIPYINNQRSDLAVFHNGKFMRIQVKTAVYDDNAKRFRCPLMTRDKNKNHIAYDETEIDFFIIQCPPLQEFYVIPSNVGCKNPNVNLYPHRDRVIALSGNIDWELYRNAIHLIE